MPLPTTFATSVYGMQITDAYVGRPMTAERTGRAEETAVVASYKQNGGAGQ